MESCQSGESTEISSFQSRDRTGAQTQCCNRREMLRGHIISIVNAWHRGNNRIPHRWRAERNWREVPFLDIRDIDGDGDARATTIAIRDRNRHGIGVLHFIV